MEIKEHLYDDERFREYVESTNDPLNALLDLLEFKWTLTDQIELNKESQRFDSEWEHRITALVIRTKSRIAQVRRELRADGRQKEMTDAVEDLRDERYEDD